jgi:hypothetical protein
VSLCHVDFSLPVWILHLSAYVSRMRCRGCTRADTRHVVSLPCRTGSCVASRHTREGLRSLLHIRSRRAGGRPSSSLSMKATDMS